MLLADRGIGIADVLHGSAPDLLIVGFALLTQLGDVWFLFLSAGVLYVAGNTVPRLGIDRRRGLFVLGLLLTYVALIGVLKELFLLPRPPGAGEPPVVDWVPAALEGVFASITTGSGHGFPSGHALGTTLVWGGFALVVTEGTLSRRWLGFAGLVVGVVSLSRLVLGVHYLVDVVAGVGLGVVILGVLYVIADHGRRPGRVLLVATGIGLMGVLHGVSFESVAAFGSAGGAWLVWLGTADSTPAHPSNRRAVGFGVAVLSLSGGLFALLYALETSPVIACIGSALALGGTVLAPLAGEELLARSGAR